MKIITVKTIIRNTAALLPVAILAAISSCNVEVKKGDAASVDSNSGSGISVEVIKDGDTLVGKKEEDTAVQHLNRMADSTRAVLRNKKKEIQKDIEQ